MTFAYEWREVAPTKTYVLRGKMKVLVVDDSNAMRKVVIRSLNACGVNDVSEASDGIEAISKYNSDQFDMIITDWIMPHKDGIEMVKDLRASGATIPIVMVTTQSQNAHLDEATTAGVTDYLNKPFTNDVLREKLEQYVKA
jgi:two-component system, chemotaxis family, chemotaxis protein CheY